MRLTKLIISLKVMMVIRMIPIMGLEESTSTTQTRLFGRIFKANAATASCGNLDTSSVSMPYSTEASTQQMPREEYKENRFRDEDSYSIPVHESPLAIQKDPSSNG